MAILLSGYHAHAQTIPMNKGSYWEFKANVTYFEKGVTKHITVNTKMLVTGYTKRNDGYEVAIISGSPENYLFYGTEDVNEVRALIKSPAGKYYMGSLKDAAAADIRSALENDDPVFKEGVKNGQAVCEDNEKTCTARYHYACIIRQQLIKVIDPVKMQTCYIMTYTSNPDDTGWTILPGAGFVHFSYHHHGTPSAVEAELVEVHKG